MTKSEFKDLQSKFNTSGMSLKAFLAKENVVASTWHYWKRKCAEESQTLPMAPITLREDTSSETNIPEFAAVALPGVTLAFPNGVRAHFGSGSEGVLMEVLHRSMEASTRFCPL